MKDRFFSNFPIWFLAIIPALAHFLLAVFLPSHPFSSYIYFTLCCLFLAVDLVVMRKTPFFSIWKILVGLLLLPYYLYLRRKDTPEIGWGPLIAWLLLFVFYLSALTIR